jgi:hypothetical protein
MTESRPRPAHRARLGGLLLLGFLVAGLMAMHGVQAAGPSGMSGVPVIGAGVMHPDSGRPSAHQPMSPESPMPGHHDPGGQVCLGLLALAFMLALAFLGLFVRTNGLFVPPGRRVRTLVRLLGRPPPSIHQLAVLRL